MATATVTRRPEAEGLAEDKHAKELLSFSFSDILWPLAFMLSLSMIGLKFPLGYLLAPVILVNRFMKDRYDFLIMTTIFLGGYNLFSGDDIHFQLYNLTAIVSFIAFVSVKRDALLRKITIGIFAYAACLVALCLISEESLRSQIHGLRDYLLICYLFFPIMAFSGKDFDIRELFRRLILYTLIFCWFDVIDSLVLGGFILLPEDMAGWYGESTFLHPIISPIHGFFIRKFTLSLALMSLCLFPVVKYYKLGRWMWIAVAGAILVCKGFSLVLGVLVVYFLLQGSYKRMMQFGIAAVLLLVTGYFVDGAISKGYSVPISGDDMGDTEFVSFGQSRLRIKSQIDQIIEGLSGDVDLETAAALGSGRGAQIIPKVELLYDLGRQWTGFGFLSRENTTNRKYIIENDLYMGITGEEEVATGVESVPVQIFLSIGYIGLIIHVAFFVWLWWLIRRYKYVNYYLSCAGFFLIVGITGFGGWITYYSLTLIGISYAAAIMAQRRLHAANPDLYGL